MYLCFHDPAFRVIPKNSSPNPRSPRFSPVLYTHLTWNACLFHSSSQPSSDCILEVSGLFSFVFIEFITILLLFYVLFFWPRGTWDPSSPTRNQAPTPATGRWSLNHWATREVPGLFSSFPYCSSPISEYFISQTLVFVPLRQSSHWVSKSQLLFQFSSVSDLRAVLSDFWTTITPFFNPQNTTRGLKGKKAKDKEAAFASFQNQSQDIKEQTRPKLCNSSLFDLNS